MEDLDYSLLYQAYSAKGRNPAVDPKNTCKILTYACSQNIYSSRKIKSACKRDINFMWLLLDRKSLIIVRLPIFVPASLQRSVKVFFYQMIRRLEDSGELSKETVFIDGTKLEPVQTNIPLSGNSLSENGKKKCSRRYRKPYSFEQGISTGLLGFSGNKDTESAKIVLFLEESCRTDYTVFIHGRGKRKSKKQRYFGLFRRFLERQAFMTGIRQAFKEEIIIIKRIDMKTLCI